jgi:hypothetical protein
VIFNLLQGAPARDLAQTGVANIGAIATSTVVAEIILFTTELWLQIQHLTTNGS